MPETKAIKQNVPSLQEAPKIEALPVQDIIEAPPITAPIATTKTCDNGHELEIRRGGAPYASNAFICNLCRRRVDAPEVDLPFLRCAHCSYDACRNCIPICDNGHELEIRRGGAPYASNAFICNLCRRRVDAPEVDLPFLRCAHCSYDACKNCIPICDNGHILKETHGNPYAIKGASGFRCDLCRRTV